MADLLYDPEQRFTCARCGRCCREFEVAIDDAERAAYLKAEAGRWFREQAGAAEGAEREPFEPIPGLDGFHRIRKRDDGTCGFLSPHGLCRLHEELGVQRKPLTCRVFPFRFHPGPGQPVATVSFSCPTVLGNQGATLRSQAADLKSLATLWARKFPEPDGALVLAEGAPVERRAVAELRSVLRALLDRPGVGGRPDLAVNVRRIAATLEDLTRRRVLGLGAERLAEYLDLTGRHAVASDGTPPPAPPARVARLLARGFLFAILALRLRREHRGRRFVLRLRLFHLLAHVHGVGPPVGRLDLAAARRVGLRLDQPSVHRIAHDYLRATLATLGTARRPVVDELALAFAVLNAAIVVGAMGAAARGLGELEAEDLAAGLLEASDLVQADRGRLARLLTGLTGGVGALHLFPVLGRPA